MPFRGAFSLQCRMKAGHLIIPSHPLADLSHCNEDNVFLFGSDFHALRHLGEVEGDPLLPRSFHSLKCGRNDESQGELIPLKLLQLLQVPKLNPITLTQPKYIKNFPTKTNQTQNRIGFHLR